MSVAGVGDRSNRSLLSWVGREGGSGDELIGGSTVHQLDFVHWCERFAQHDQTPLRSSGADAFSGVLPEAFGEGEGVCGEEDDLEFDAAAVSRWIGRCRPVLVLSADHKLDDPDVDG